jgi:nucleoside-diphosphate-sugar epimerase
MKVTGLKRPSSRLNRVGPLLNDLELVDIAEGWELSLNQLFAERKFEVVIHVATCYGRNGEPLSVVQSSNVDFPLKLLELSARHGVPLFLNTDTFFNTPQLNYEYLAPYALSKKHFWEWGKLFAAQQKIKFFNLKLFHVFGEGDGDQKFIALIAQQLIRNVPEIALTDGTQERDFIYVEDVLDAYILLLREVKNMSTFCLEIEVGSGVLSSVSGVIRLLRELSGSNSQLNFGALPQRSGELPSVPAEISFLKKLGWAPKYSLRAGLEKVIAEIVSRH